MKFVIFFLSIALRTLVNITKYIHFYFNFTFLKCNYFLSRMHQWKKLYQPHNPSTFESLPTIG